MPFQAPPLPYHFVERPEHQNAVKKILLEDAANHPGTLVVSAIHGLGGIGKSVMAMKLAHDQDVVDRYCDGVLWAPLGQQPDILAHLSHWIQTLGDHSYQPITETAASAHLRTLLADKRMLLVVDDVWNPEHAELFRVGSSNCCVLITTREARIPQARRYPLDVMSPEQSLALMTQKLGRALDEQEQQQALLFAERVGYLPLALELTASQIEEGVTWTELLEDFKTEVARLETLDLYSQDDIPEDTKRRKYSLTACFKLSLKQLTPEQLRHFAWLGVVPEDVTLTQEMATTLWQVSKRTAGAILRIFSAKALLLKSGQQSCQRVTYRMHDLMHDLAQKLLTSPQHPEQASDLPGLGLTRAEAHQQIIERYREKTLDEQWHTLSDDGYIHAHLTWHLEQAEQFDQIHQLLQEDTPEGRNGWYKACVALEQTASFVGDVARAWRLAKDLYKESPAQAIALQCRYALIRASLNSLAENIPYELVAALV
ncbi:MAG: NB-ARC domain-containing protein, partial [Leptolyngbyaceae cyanobacterium]